MTEHKALSAFEQAKLQEEVEALKQRVARLTEALATTNELRHNLAILAMRATGNQEEGGE